MHRFSEAHDGPLAEFLLDLLQGDVKVLLASSDRIDFP